MSAPLTGVGTVFRRELATVVRTPGYGVLAVGLLVAVGGLLAAGGGGATGFVPAVVDLLLPTEALVPLAAVVLGYRALLADGASGELTVIRTYPVRVGEYVAGVLLARTVALVGVVGVPYALVGVWVWLTAAPDTGIFATHAGIDSPVLYLRFLAFVLCFGAAYVSIAAAVSALAASRRSAIALGVLALVAGVLGGDLLLLRSLGAGASPATIPGSIALTPNGAFRGLVFEHVIGVAFAPEGGFVSTGRAVASLVGWTLFGAVVSAVTLAYGRRIDAAVERVRSGSVE
ncbi:copper ABC transporter permease [Halorubrum sp. BOL3-1]|uniref:copper ABC transporter permease n=1 Tax=Halorubrum sp. BOL3-1 TaxID=2497325 RepID=UPI001004E660|nr:copper ABC transporter permease [Halorubrum sp. BOL3-1]QAU14138.1 copper ABC transporter permease [Halorubrum sp. BOL3-1]